MTNLINSWRSMVYNIVRAFYSNKPSVILPEEPVKEKVEWHPLVHETAKQDGYKPEDFQWEQWPVSNVRLTETTTRHMALIYECDLPPSTPLCNIYTEEGEKIPDPVGMCVAWVVMRLRNEADDIVDESLTLANFDRSVWSGLNGNFSWILPGEKRKVRLSAMPKFFFLNEDGGGCLGYSRMSDGYFPGKEVYSDWYTIAMDEDGNIKVH